MKAADTNAPPASAAGDIELKDRASERTSLLQRTRDSMEPQIEKVRTFVDDFYDFIQQGNMIDLAVGLILGKSFSALVDSFVGDILSPILSLFSEKSLANYYAVARCPPLVLHCTSDTWATWQQARDAGAITINYGQFVENLINFVMNALFLYITIKKILEVVFKRTIISKPQLV